MKASERELIWNGVTSIETSVRKVIAIIKATIPGSTPAVMELPERQGDVEIRSWPRSSWAPEIDLRISLHLAAQRIQPA